MKSCIQYTKESVKEMKEDMLSWKNRLLKVKTRDEFTVTIYPIASNFTIIPTRN
jgi:hypothetical protein